MQLKTSSYKDILLARWGLIKNENGEIIYLFGPNHLPIKIKNKVYSFKWFTWLKDKNLPENKEEFLEDLPSRDFSSLQQSSLLTFGDFCEADEAVIRLHSICHTGDIFGSQRCDCGSQLHESLEKIVTFGTGGLFYLANHEGRGIGLFNKALTYALQEEGLDTAEANRILKLEVDNRSYEDVVLVLKYLREKPVILLSNNPDKNQFLCNYEVPVSRMEPLLGEVNEHNHFYLTTKAKVFLHNINLPNQ